jgi:hypothetical protein
MTPWRFLIGAGLVMTLAFLVLTRDPINEPLVANLAGWQANQPIYVNTPDPPVISAWEERFPEFDEVVNKTEPLRIYCVPPPNRSPLELVSPIFSAPEYVSLLVLGDMHQPTNSVYFERSDNQERFFIRTQTSLRYWQRATYHMPPTWVGRSVRLMASVVSIPKGGGIGISNPRALNRSAILRAQLRTLAYLAGYIVALVLFVAPGLAVSLHYAPRTGTVPILIVPLALVCSSLLGYVEFWVTFLNPSLSQTFAWAVALAGPAALVWVVRRRGALLRCEDIRIPLTLWVLVGLFYLAVTFSFDLGKPGVAHTTTRFLDEELSIDAHLPSLFAEELSRGPLKLPTWVLNWRSSDRPPLQTGIALLQRPLASAIGLTPWALYLPLGCALQCAWLPILWAVFRAAGLSYRRSGLALLFLVLSGFIMVNSAFIWPKMFSAALALVVVLFALFTGVVATSPPWARAVMPGLAAGLASLAHGGVLFLLLPLGALFLLPRWSPGLAKLFVAAAAFLALWLPWSWYQSLDPPGDRLVKIHLAGAKFQENYIVDGGRVSLNSPFQIGDQEYPERTPVWRALVAAYRPMSLRQILKNKWANLRVLFIENGDVEQSVHQTIPEGSVSFWRGFRRREFFTLFWSLGLLNVGWVVLLAAWWRRQSVGLGSPIPYLIAASLTCWLLLMFGPGTTVPHQGPYPTFLLLFGVLSAALSTLPRYAILLLLGAQGISFTAAWLWTSAITSYALINPLMIFLSAAFLLAVIHQALSGIPDGTVPLL